MQKSKSSDIQIGKFIKNNFQAVISLGIFILAYVPTLFWMWDRWFARDSYYSHGILIPFVVIYLIWQKKEELAAIKRERSAWGIPLIVLGMVIHIVSSMFRIYFTSGFSMLFVLSGIVLYFYGGKVFRKILFPLFFLIFMVPAPEVVIANVSFKMKLFAAQIATAVLNGMGLAALREGSLIMMSHAHVMVEDVCSGLRSLISLAALGSIFAYWMKGVMWKRLVLFLSTIPIAVATNVFRIIFLAVISEVWGAQYATGFTHDLSGFLVFGVAFILLFTVGKLLE